MSENRGSLAACFLSGVLLTMAFPKPGLWPLALIGLVPMVLTITGRSSRTAFLYGYLTGFVHAVTLLYWVAGVMVTYGGVHPFLAWPILGLLAAYLALYPGLFALGLAWVQSRLGRRPGGVAWVCAGAALYAGLEYFKSFFLTGFPWEPLGAALAASPTMVSLADVVGTGGLTFFLAMINLGLAGVVPRFRDAGWRAVPWPAGLALASLALLTTYGVIRLAGIEDRMARAETKPVAMAQGSIEQSLKWDPAERINTLLIYRDLTMKAARGGAWLTVWPETAAPFVYGQDQAATDWLNDLARQADRGLLFGAPAVEVENGLKKYYNRAYLLDPNARILGYYDKVHLVPYGEYVPLKEYFPFISKITQATGEYYSGQSGKLLTLEGTRVGVLICFESIFAELARESALAGADYLAVITNDAWFGRSAAPYQHLDQAILRAVETRRTVIRAANTGISALILPDGRIQGLLELYARDVLFGRAPRLTEETIYTAVGDLIPRACLGLTLVLFAAVTIGRRYVSRFKTIS